MRMPLNKIGCRGVRGILSASFAIFLLALVAGTAQGQTLLSETTWGGPDSDVARGVALAPDGSSYVVGDSDSFTTDQFGQARFAISLVKFDPFGSLVWQRIWTGLTAGAGGVALSTDGLSVYVSGTSTSLTNASDALLLKFDADGNLIWQRTWGGSDSEAGNAVATGADGSVHIAGISRTDAGSANLFVVKFDSAGMLVWQKIWEGVAGFEAVAVAPDGSVFAAGTRFRPGGVAEYDVVVVKMTSAGALVWDKTFSAGEVVDPRGGMAVSPDGSIVIAGAIQAAKGGGIVGIAALLIKLDADGKLLFDREWGGRIGDAAAGVAVASDGSIYIAGASNSFGAGDGDAFVVHVQANGKAAEAATWGGTAFESGAGVGVGADGTVVLAATTTTAPPYSLLDAPRKVSAVRGIVADVVGTFRDAAGGAADPGPAVDTPTGSTTYGGNFETALVRLRLIP